MLLRRRVDSCRGRSMKSWIAFAFLMVLCVPNLASAQRSSDDLNTLLRDSEYVFNRFEEVSPGMSVDIDKWNAPDELKKSAESALSSILRNVEVEKPALDAVLGKTDVSSTDLLDVYAEMVEVASELGSGSEEEAIFGGGESSRELSQLGSKATVLGAKIGVALRLQIADQELKLASCSRKASHIK